MIDAIRKFFGGERKDIRNLIKVAFAQGKIDELDIDYLNKELAYLNLNEKQVKRNKSAFLALKNKLPKDPFRVYQLIYGLTRKLMSTNMLTDKKEYVLKRLITVFTKNLNNINELIHFLKYNIRYGNSIEDSYSRLGYLLLSA